MRFRITFLTLALLGLLLTTPTPDLAPLLHAQSTGLNRTTTALLTNKSGGAVVYGDVVVLDNTNASSFTTTTTAAISTRGLGVVLDVGGIANNATGTIAIGGWVPRINLNTAATVGQFLKTHTVAGQATPHSSPQVEGDFAVALSASANPPGMLFGSANPPAGSSGTAITSLTGDVTGTGPGATATTIANSAVTLAKIANAAASSTLVGSGASGSGAPYVEVTLGTNLAMSGTTLNATGGGGGSAANATINGRLTTESAVPVSTSDRTAQATIYLALYNGDQLGLYTGAAWTVLNYTQLSLGLSGLTSGKNYDVFVDYNGGTPQLVLSAAWASDTTRTDAIALQDGIYVKSGTTTYRFVGTIRTTSTTTTEDSAANRFIWNAYNRVPRALRAVKETTDSWVYNSTTWHQANGNTANQLNFVMGLALDSPTAFVNGEGSGSGAYSSSIGIGCNSTSTQTFPWATFATGSAIGVSTQNSCPPVLGYSFIAWLEADNGSTTFFGDGGTPAILQTGISGSILN